MPRSARAEEPEPSAFAFLNAGAPGHHFYVLAAARGSAPGKGTFFVLFDCCPVSDTAWPVTSLFCQGNDPMIQEHLIAAGNLAVSLAAGGQHAPSVPWPRPLKRCGLMAFSPPRGTSCCGQGRDFGDYSRGWQRVRLRAPLPFSEQVCSCRGALDAVAKARAAAIKVTVVEVAAAKGRKAKAKDQRTMDSVGDSEQETSGGSWRQQRPGSGKNCSNTRGPPSVESLEARGERAAALAQLGELSAAARDARKSSRRPYLQSAFRIKLEGRRVKSPITMPRTRPFGFWRATMRPRPSALAASLGTAACATSCVTRTNRSEAPSSSRSTAPSGDTAGLAETPGRLPDACARPRFAKRGPARGRREIGCSRHAEAG